MGQFAVIGLGNFGFYLATHLYRKGHEVMAVDRDQDKVQQIKDDVTQAVVADATDRKALEALGIRGMDAAVVSIGSTLDASILVTLNLKEMGMERVLAKAISEPHGRILERLGVSEVLFPEKDTAINLAERLDNPYLLDFFPLVEGYNLMEMAPPKAFIGKALKDLDLINRYGVQVVAVKELVPDKLNIIPTGNFVLKDSDIMILLGPSDALEKLREKNP